MGLGGLDECGCLGSIDFWENGVGVRSISALLCNSSSLMLLLSVSYIFCPSILFVEVAKEYQFHDRTMLSLFDPSESYLENLDIRISRHFIPICKVHTVSIPRPPPYYDGLW
jgi:hypothetical protein